MAVVKYCRRGAELSRCSPWLSCWRVNLSHKQPVVDVAQWVWHVGCGLIMHPLAIHYKLVLMVTAATQQTSRKCRVECGLQKASCIAITAAKRTQVAGGGKDLVKAGRQEQGGHACCKVQLSNRVQVHKTQHSLWRWM